jgi:hypothetical protein
MKACQQFYFSDNHTVRGVVSNVCSFYDAIGDILTFQFPRPFQLVALTGEGDLPSSGAPPSVYQNSLITLKPTADQSTYAEMVQAIFIAFMFANSQPAGTTNGNESYVSGSFFEYFAKFVGGNKIFANYNAIIMPGNDIIQFWKDEQTTPVPSTLRARLRELDEWIFTMAEKPFYGAPGIYQIFNATAGGGLNSSPYGDLLATYLAANGNKICFRTNEINAFGLQDIIKDNDFPPPVITPNTLNYDPGIPNAIGWE